MWWPRRPRVRTGRGRRPGAASGRAGRSRPGGTDANFSENYGAEGETTDAGIAALRKGQIKNFLLTLLISRGVPMLLGGDEFRRTQGGNNNADRKSTRL